MTPEEASTAIGASAPGEGRIVEIGSWKGASACLLAGGLARRGQGRLTGVDPHAGGPPWLGLAPFRGTLESSLTTTTGAGVALLLDMRVGRVVVCLADEVERFGTALQVGDILLVCNDGCEEGSLPIHHSLLGSRLRRLRLAGAAALGRAPAARPVAG